jgi:hypothetical protein
MVPGLVLLAECDANASARQLPDFRAGDPSDETGKIPGASRQTLLRSLHQIAIIHHLIRAKAT